MTASYQHVYEGAGAPTSAPGSIGAHYTNTSNGDQYLAKGTASAADWELQEKAGAGAAAVSAHEGAANPHPQYAASAAPAAAVAAHTQEADPHAQYQQKEAGKGLSSNDYTAAEKAKLAALEGSHFKGVYVDLAALIAAVPAPAAGDYADVDAGAGSEVVRHVWDATDSAWKPQLGASAQLTAAQVKALYESNLDTNAFTDAEKAKLAGLGGAGGLAANLSVPESLLKLIAKTRPLRDSDNVTTFGRVIPAETQAGDLLVACISSTGGPSLVDPAGWVRVAESPAVGSQRISAICTRIAQAGDAGSTVNWTNSSWPDFTLQIFVFRGASAASVADANGAYVDATGTNQLPIAPVTATRDGQIAIAAVSNVYSDVSLGGVYPNITIPAGWMPLSDVDYNSGTDGINIVRDHFALKVLASGEVAQGSFVSAAAGAVTANSIASATALLTV